MIVLKLKLILAIKVHHAHFYGHRVVMDLVGKRINKTTSTIKIVKERSFSKMKEFVVISKDSKILKVKTK